MTEFKNSLLNVISNPKFVPPENLMELDLTSFRSILRPTLLSILVDELKRCNLHLKHME